MLNVSVAFDGGAADVTFPAEPSISRGRRGIWCGVARRPSPGHPPHPSTEGPSIPLRYGRDMVLVKLLGIDEHWLSPRTRATRRIDRGSNVVIKSGGLV